jgi:hypothetical protein
MALLPDDYEAIQRARVARDRGVERVDPDDCLGTGELAHSRWSGSSIRKRESPPRDLVSQSVSL